MHNRFPLRICLVGPHGAGKSTLGAAVAQRLGVEFRDEIGRHLREAALAADPDQHALRFDADFDRRVIEGELERDAARGARHGFVVETWHPGNLAYARIRSPQVSRWLEPAARAAARRCGDLVVVPVTASRDALMARCNEPGGTLDERTDFFLHVAAEATRVATRWGLRVTPPVDTSNADVETCVAAVIAAAESARLEAAASVRSAA